MRDSRSAHAPVHQLIEALHEDAECDEFCVDRFDAIWAFSARFGIKAVASPFQTEDHLVEGVFDFVWKEGIRLDPKQPSAGGVKDSTRWQCCVAPLSAQGPILSLRKLRFDEVSLRDFAFAHAMHLDQIRDALRDQHHVVVAGPTGSGKTTFLSALLVEKERCSGPMRIVCVEAIKELGARTTSWAHLVGRSASINGEGEIKVENLVREALRLRPDQLVIGEIRGSEIAAWLEAMTAGHGGVYTTVHASNMEELRRRLELLAVSYGGEGLRMMTNEIMAGSRSHPLTAIFLKRGAPPQISSVVHVVGDDVLDRRCDFRAV